MSDFVAAAFPWVAFGIAIAVILTYMNSKNKTKEHKKHKEEY